MTRSAAPPWPEPSAVAEPTGRGLTKRPFSISSPPAGASTRRLYAGASVVVAVALAAAVVAPGGGGWQLVAFAIAPDLAGLLSIDPSLRRGQMHPRAVPLYNALHHLAGPVLLGLLALAWLGLPWLVGALAWALHITVDRAVGYGPRTPEGFRRD